MSLQTMKIDFSGNLRSIQGDVTMQGFGDAAKKGIIAFGICCILAVLSFAVPFIGWTAPFIFLGIGPLVGIAIFFLDRHEVKRVESQAVCPECNTYFSISERNFKPPFYGCCPNCRMTYRVDITE